MKSLPEEEAPKTAFRVLVVEDDAIIGMFYEDILADMGHKVRAIERTEGGAVAAAGRLKPDLMIVDAALQEGNGLSAVQKILRTGFVPHVFVSGDMVRVQSLMPGAIVLQKPFLARDLAHAIQRALRVAPKC